MVVVMMIIIIIRKMVRRWRGDSGSRDDYVGEEE